MTRTVVDRFRSYVDRSAGRSACWPWTGARRKRYGRLTVEGRSETAHRLAWRLATHRQIPSGMCIYHTCGNTLCCNPKHLRLGKSSLQRTVRAPSIGERFGRWQVVGRGKRSGSWEQRRPYVLCRCSCGTERLLMVHNLVTGKTTGCMECAGRVLAQRVARKARVPAAPRVLDLAWLPQPDVMTSR